MALFSQWEILMARIPNTDGSSPPYPHPCIYLGESQKFAGKLLVLGITSDLTQRVPEYSIDLPWTKNGGGETGLYAPSLAQVHWTDHIMPAEVHVT